MAKSDPANDYVPKNYEDLYRYYFIGDGLGNSLVHKLIRSMLPYATDDERETLSQDIMERILKTDQLKVFNPAKANFGGVIFYVTRSIVSNHLDRKGRTPLTGMCVGSLSETDPEDGEFEPGVYSLDRLFGTEKPNQDEAIDAAYLIQQLRIWTGRLKKEVPAGREGETAFKRMHSLDSLVLMMAEGYEPDEMGAKLGVTASTIHNWMGVLREKLRELQEALG